MANSSPFKLRCEYEENPIGVGQAKPRLSWWLRDPRRGAAQSAYQIQAGSRPKGRTLWDSGTVASSQSTLVPYAGKPLGSSQQVYWRVRVWDQEGKPSAWSEPAFFETALLAPEDWAGQWLSFPDAKHDVPGPGIYFRRGFRTAKPVVRATLYATARGIYIPYLNGQRVGADRMTPGWSDYRQRLRYQTYDLTPLLRSKDNAIGLIVADGWFRGHLVWKDANRFYGDQLAVLAQIRLQYADGSTETIATDSAWKVTDEGAIVSSSFYHGDEVDAGKELRGWAEGGYDDSHWKTPVAAGRDPVALDAYVGPAVRQMDVLKPIEHWQLPNGDWVFDLGQNMVGVARLKVRGQRGEKIVIRHGEILNPDAQRTVYYTNLRSARCTDTFTLAGQANGETFEPPFTLHGFRYVQVSGLGEKPAEDAVAGMVYHSAAAPAGTFECSNAKLNQLQHNIVWGQKGNFVEVPTDCPQRDERLGWMGDAQVFARTATYNMDLAGFFTRWLVDVGDGQRSNGAFPDVVPDVINRDSLTQSCGNPAWADAGVICPWITYLVYADKSVLKTSYPGIKKYIAYLVENSPRFVRPAVGYGDWLAIGSDTPKDLIGTAYSAYSAKLAADIARVLGHAKDARQFKGWFEAFKSAFNREFVTPGGRIVGASQTADVLALAFDLVDGAARQRVIEHLANDIETRGVLTTGFVGVNPMLPTLSKIGRDDLAYRLLLNEKFPSWLFSVNHGATTIWERWDGWTPEKGFQTPEMNSFNHYAYGSCGQWMYGRIAGIDLDAARPGYRHINLRPMPGGGLTWAKACFDCIYGTIKVAWEIEQAKMTLRVTVPANTTATLHAPGEIEDADGGKIDKAKRAAQLPAGTFVIRVAVPV